MACPVTEYVRTRCVTAGRKWSKDSRIVRTQLRPHDPKPDESTDSGSPNQCVNPVFVKKTTLAVTKHISITFTQKAEFKPPSVLSIMYHFIRGEYEQQLLAECSTVASFPVDSPSLISKEEWMSDLALKLDVNSIKQWSIHLLQSLEVVGRRGWPLVVRSSWH